MDTFEDRLKKLEAENPDEVVEHEEAFIPTYDHDPEFQAYKREFYRLRYEFFKRAPELVRDCLDEKTCGKDGHLCPNCRACAEWELRGATYKHLAESDSDTGVRPENITNIRDFTLRVNLRSTMEQIDAEIARQIKQIKRRIKEAKATSLIARDYHHAHRSGKKNTGAYWRRCLLVFDLRTKNKSWQEIAIELDAHGYRRDHGPTKKAGSLKPTGSCKADMRADYDEALRLINSAATGTFPD